MHRHRTRCTTSGREAPPADARQPTEDAMHRQRTRGNRRRTRCTATGREATDGGREAPPPDAMQSTADERHRHRTRCTATGRDAPPAAARHRQRTRGNRRRTRCNRRPTRCSPRRTRATGGGREATVGRREAPPADEREASLTCTGKPVDDAATRACRPGWRRRLSSGLRGRGRFSVPRLAEGKTKRHEAARVAAELVLARADALAAGQAVVGAGEPVDADATEMLFRL